jgi:apocytochrome f
MLVVTVVGQVYPTGESNMNVFGATQAGQITEITIAEKGESIVIVDSKGNKVSQVIPAGLSLMVKQGDTVKLIKH